MAATTPVAIGTRGTVASLVRKEIEHFTKSQGSNMRSLEGIVGEASNGNNQSRPSLWSLMKMSWKKKKRRGSSGNLGFLPRICSVVEVSEKYPLNGIPGFSYRILKEDVDHFQA